MATGLSRDRPDATRVLNRDTRPALDTLTGIANRRLFEYQGEQALAVARRHHNDLALVLFRIDNLEDIAVQLGLAQAKNLLHRIAVHLENNARSHDTAGRLSRSRFGMLLPGTHELGAHKFAARLLVVLRRATATPRVPCVISGAVAATDTSGCERFSELDAYAAQRLTTAIAAGGNRVVSSFSAEQPESTSAPPTGLQF